VLCNRSLIEEPFLVDISFKISSVFSESADTHPNAPLVGQYNLPEQSTKSEFSGYQQQNNALASISANFSSKSLDDSIDVPPGSL